jgi:MFS transporter, UMF1 family
MQTLEKKITLNDSRTINAWAIFDWANSAYSLVISAAVFPAYYLKVTDKVINVFGIELSNSTLYAYSVSLAFLIVGIFSPLLAGIADYGGKKRFFMRMFTTIGSLGCLALYWFRGMDELWIGIIGFMVATIGYSGSLVFYNSFLPEIASADQFDRISARGFSLGYVGSVLLLVANLICIMNPEMFGFADGKAATRFAFVTVAIWWIGFSQITFAVLPESNPKPAQGNILTKGMEEIGKVWRNIQLLPNVKGFLLAFFVYSMGVQTILYMAATFAEVELRFETSELIQLILLLQIVAIVGATFFAWFSKLYGNKISLLIMLCIWCCVCVAAYLVQTKMGFYGVAAWVGMVMGGIQALSRATYAKLLPQSMSNETTSFFSFYDVLEKASIVLGTLTFGIVEQLSGGIRNSGLAMVVFFIGGLILLRNVTIPKEEKLEY